MLPNAPALRPADAAVAPDGARFTATIQFQGRDCYAGTHATEAEAWDAARRLLAVLDEAASGPEPKWYARYCVCPGEGEIECGPFDTEAEAEAHVEKVTKCACWSCETYQESGRTTYGV